MIWWSVGILVPAPCGHGEIDGLLVPTGKASYLLTGHLTLMSEPVKEKWLSHDTIHTYKLYWPVICDVL